ncbi:MAG: hypothetical protein VR73_05320 [Gammaproteobacteria bacterium BRH_c0]|nr:MAG: hypothetical protein VR73_05320 [Gammaproteobacteria bacterium BRH_c0]
MRAGKKESPNIDEIPPIDQLEQLNLAGHGIRIQRLRRAKTGVLILSVMEVKLLLSHRLTHNRITVFLCLSPGTT